MAPIVLTRATLVHRLPCLSRLPQLFSTRRFSSRKSFTPLRDATRHAGKAPSPGAFTLPEWVDPETVNYASKKEKSRILTEQQLGPLSPEARALSTALKGRRIDPFEALKTHIDRGTADLHVIRVCLAAAKEHAWSVPRRRRQALLPSKQRPFASLILKYIWTDVGLWAPLVASDYQSQAALCYFAVQEDLQHLMLNWLKVEDPPGLKEVSPNPGARRWRENLLRNLVIALDMDDRGYKADKAIKCFLDFKEWRTSARKTMPSTGGTSMSTLSAFFEIRGFLSSGWCYRTDPKLFEKFRNHMDDYNLDAESYEFTQVKFSLFHPASPDASLAMEFLRRRDSHGQLLPAIQRIKNSFQHTMERAFAVSKAYGHMQDANWIATKYRESFGKELAVRDPLQRGLPGWEDSYTRTAPRLRFQPGYKEEQHRTDRD